MSKSNRQYVFDTFEILSTALRPFVEARLKNALQESWRSVVDDKVTNLCVVDGEISWDLEALLTAITIFWDDAFKAVLGEVENSYVSELQGSQDRLGDDDSFSSDDTERALDTAKRLLEAISARDSAEKVGSMREAMMRRRIDEQRRNGGRKRASEGVISTGTKGGLRPWREVVRPHDDVASGRFQTAEFAADLATVHSGNSSSEYGDPKKFYSRTCLTTGLKDLLVNGAKRLTGSGGDPVIELQTNFGGGKTHSMLALYHMCGPVQSSDLFGLDELLSGHDLTIPAEVNRAVIVGTARSPVEPIRTDNGLCINTLWGDMAWQLGGKIGYDLVAESDRAGVSPGRSTLAKLFAQCSPCLILIDEWVAYLRQIYKVDGCPSGSFDANITFVQSVTEEVKACPRAFLVASLPKSEIEVGGEGGQEALKCLQTTFGRLDTGWTPASTEESYKIVRQRLFQDVEADMFQARDSVIEQYAKLYRDNPDPFPVDCREADYRDKIAAAYPIHPELFDRLYHTWGTLDRFQKTRGVLRMMANLIHELWMNSDPSLMIMPGCVAVGATGVQPELLKCLPRGWDSIIGGDVDGKGSTPFGIDQSTPGFGQVSATRRVARAVFMATAPLEGSQNQGVETKRTILGVCQPGEQPVVFEDALRRLSSQAKYMHTGPGGAWYARNPSINRMAAERELNLDDAVVAYEIDKALDAYVRSQRNREPFHAVQVSPGGSADVPDEAEGVRLVILGGAYPHNGKPDSLAVTEAREIFANRGKSSRYYRNTLVFLAVDQNCLIGVFEMMRKKLAWQSILEDNLNLLQTDLALAERNLDEAKRVFEVRLQEAWCQVLYPTQDKPQEDVKWSTMKIPSQDRIFDQIGKKMKSAEGIFTEIGARRLHSALTGTIWSDKPHLQLSEIWDYCNRFTYLPRLCSRNVLKDSVGKAISGIAPGPFAYADSVRGEANYDGLLIREGNPAVIVVDSHSVIVREDVAQAQVSETPCDEEESSSKGSPTSDTEGQPPAEVESLPRIFYGMVELSSERPAKDMGRIFDEVVSHISESPGGSVVLRLEIEGDAPQGFSKEKVRILLENSLVLGFKERKVK